MSQPAQQRATVSLPGSKAAAVSGTTKSAKVPSPLASPTGHLSAPEPMDGKKEWRYKGRKVTLRSVIFLTLDDPSFTSLSKAYSLAMMLLILLVTICFVLESEAENATGLLVGTSALQVFQWIELVSVIIFTTEYVLRLLTFPIKKSWRRSACRFILTPFNIIDALACFPFWITFIIQAIDPEFDAAGFGFVRAVRLVRITRVFKIGKYSVGIQMFLGAMTRSIMSLSILLLLLCLGVILVASIMNLAEGGLSDPSSPSYDEALLNAIGFDASAHQVCFGTIPRCFWWALVTMTTVGYGDCYPLSIAGKAFTSLTMIAGTIILALPITVVGSNFQAIVEMYEADTAQQLEAKALDMDGDGQIDEMELREYLLEKRKEGVLRKGLEHKPVDLLRKYDEENKGWLTVDEYKKLSKDVIDPDAKRPDQNIRILLTRTETMESKINAIQSDVEARLDRIEVLLAMALNGRVKADGAGQDDQQENGNGEGDKSLLTPRLDQADTGSGVISPEPELTEPRARSHGLPPIKSPFLKA